MTKLAIQIFGLIFREVFRANEQRQAADGAKGTHQEVRPQPVQTDTKEEGKGT